MATFWETATHSINHMFSLLCRFVVLVVSRLGFKSRNLGLIAPVPGHCFPLTFLRKTCISLLTVRTVCNISICNFSY